MIRTHRPGIYSVTFSWLIGQLRRGRRVAWWAGTVAAVLLGVEMVIIVGQALRTTTSHFNVGTTLDSAMFSVMGASIALVWVATLVISVVLFASPGPDPARNLAIRAGALISVAGMALGFLMTIPTQAQLQDFQGIAGAHTVGLPDGGPGLPLLGWSTVGGDLRIPHFVGMHALQALPLFLIVLELASAAGCGAPRQHPARPAVGLAAAGSRGRGPGHLAGATRSIDRAAGPADRNCVRRQHRGGDGSGRSALGEVVKATPGDRGCHPMTGALFGLTFTVAAPFWAVMILLPNWRSTQRIAASPLIAVPPGRRGCQTVGLSHPARGRCHIHRTARRGAGPAREGHHTDEQHAPCHRGHRDPGPGTGRPAGHHRR